jgi:hypothetical protein
MKAFVLLFGLTSLLLFSQTSCQKKQPPDVLPDSTFVSVYAKLTSATVTARPVPPDSLSSARMVDSILNQEGVSREQFNATVQWYDQDVKRWKPIFDEVVLALEDSVRKQQKH